MGLTIKTHSQNANKGTKGTKQMIEKKQEKNVSTYIETNIKQLLSILPHILKQRYGVLLRAPHGVGKSEITAQMCKSLPKHLGIDDEVKELRLIDRRLSQCPDAGDITGLPSINKNENRSGETDVKGTTSLNPMDWFYYACKEPCLLLFDELDRAQQDVKQAVFEVGDSRKIAGHYLHPNTVVMACTNGGMDASSQYTVKKMDPAELDRWAVVEFRPTVNEWLEWGKTKNENGEPNVLPIITQFIDKNRTHLEFKGNIEPNKVYPSRRSWKRFSDSLPREWIENKNPLIQTLGYTFVGYEASAKFMAYIENQKFSVNVYDIITKGDFSSMENTSTPKLAEAITKMCALDEVVKPMKKKHLENFKKFVEKLPDEQMVYCWESWGQATHEDNVTAIFADTEFSGRVNAVRCSIDESK